MSDQTVSVIERVVCSSFPQVQLVTRAQPGRRPRFYSILVYFSAFFAMRFVLLYEGNQVSLQDRIATSPLSASPYSGIHGYGLRH